MFQMPMSSAMMTTMFGFFLFLFCHFILLSVLSLFQRNCWLHGSVFRFQVSGFGCSD